MLEVVLPGYKRKLSTKITLFTTSVIAIATIAIAVIVYNVVNKTFQRQAINSFNIESKLISNNIQNGLIKLVSDISILSKTPPIQGIVRSIKNGGIDREGKSDLNIWKFRLATIFESMLKVNKEYTQIRYIQIGGEGMEIVRVNRTGNDVYRVKDEFLQSKKNRGYYHLAAKLSEGSIGFSKISFNIEKGKVEVPYVPTLRVVFPVYESSHSVFGFIVINVNIQNYLRNILTSNSHQYDMILYDKYKDLFVYDSNDEVLNFFTPNDADLKIKASATPIEVENIIDNYMDDSDKVVSKRVIYTSSNKDHKFLDMIVVIPKDKLLSVERSIGDQIFAWIFMICIISSILVYLFTLRLTKRLSDMADQIEATINNRNAKLSLPVHLDDEVGFLARSFQRKAEILQNMALFDGLTGLANRKNFHDHLDIAIFRSKRNFSTFAVVFIDINKFKEINDNYGHDYGDELLMKFSDNLKKITRESELCARLGGDEFAVIAEESGNGKKSLNVDSLIKRQRKELEKIYHIKGVSINLTVSIGVAVFPENGEDIESLMKYADVQMYKEKNSRA